MQNAFPPFECFPDEFRETFLPYLQKCPFLNPEQVHLIGNSILYISRPEQPQNPTDIQFMDAIHCALTDLDLNPAQFLFQSHLDPVDDTVHYQYTLISTN